MSEEVSSRYPKDGKQPAEVSVVLCGVSEHLCRNKHRDCSVRESEKLISSSEGDLNAQSRSPASQRQK
jgi:hypothetical protein